MKNKMILWIGILLLLLMSVAVATYILTQTDTDSPDGQLQEIVSFEDCVAAGNAVMESYPRQCRANGQTFTEDIGNELELTDLITINNPRPNQSVSSPLTVSGDARGYWFFEASFPVMLMDANGNILVEHYAEAQGDWMTEDFVPFEAEIDFNAPTTSTGLLVLERSNPSGLPENENALTIPVRFADFQASSDDSESICVDLCGNGICEEIVCLGEGCPCAETPQNCPQDCSE